jgi:hypothetical protein
MKRGENLRKYDHSGPTYRTRPIEYRVWAGMKVRCVNPNGQDWLLYGGRGIRVCERWSGSFAAFFEDMGPRPTSRHSIDRIDSDGHYEPANCRWATAKEQANNWKTRNRRITYNGETLTVPQWAERLGLTRESLRDRLDSGWSIERAVTTPAVRQRTRAHDGTFQAVSN